MTPRFLSILACPACRQGLAVSEARVKHGDRILEGTLLCTSCRASYPIRKGIPRFVPSDGLDTFDWYTPKYQHKHTWPEVYRWYEESGFVKIRLNQGSRDASLLHVTMRGKKA